MSNNLDREAAIFQQALALPPGNQRDSYLAEACGDDTEQLSRIVELLQIHDEGHGSLEPAALLQMGAYSADDRRSSHPSMVAGTMIGPYKLLEPIGEGGFGIVYLAEQEKPLRRRVALKVIKPGMDTRRVITRFETERQVLALMEHPNIARVIDAGQTDAGRPYFVMELVQGVPITAYCDAHKLTIRERLELFRTVCLAVRHAHQKGIIHRDLKPSNVLVAEHDGQAVPKIIDFGVAKATASYTSEVATQTRTAQFIGTPLYMSPEQATLGGIDIDTRSDVYSLGVLLYELLTGGTPFDAFRKLGLDELRRVIREEEPPHPSQRISTLNAAADSTISQNRGLDPRSLRQLLSAELDWIVAQALEKDRTRRYQSAAELGAEVQRYLNDEPVLASPPSATYRWLKLARRNQAALITASLVTLLLFVTVAVVAGSIGWVSRDQAARRLVVEQTVSRALAESNELQKQEKWLEALVAVERAEAALASGEASAALHAEVREQLMDLRIVERLEKLRTQSGPDLLRQHDRISHAYASAFLDFGIDTDRHSPPYIAELIRRRPRIAVRLAAALDDWAVIVRDWGIHDQTRDPASWKRLVEAARLADPDPWRSQLRRAMAQEDLNVLQKLADTADIPALQVQSLRLMGNALAFGKDGPGCVAWLRKAHRQHPGDAIITFDLAYHLGVLPSADQKEVLRFAEAALAAQPIASMYRLVGRALRNMNRHDEAYAVYLKSIELDPKSSEAHTNVGLYLSQEGKLDQAIESFHKAIELDPTWDFPQHNLGVALVKQEKLDQAISSYRKAIELDPNNVSAHIYHGVALLNQGKWDEAIASYQKAVELNPRTISALINLGYTFFQQGRLDDAIASYRKAIEFEPNNAIAHSKLGEALAKHGKLDEAIAICRKAVELDPKYVWPYQHLGFALGEQGKWDEATASYRKSIEINPNWELAYHNLGNALLKLGKLDEAITSYRKVIELVPKDAFAHIHLGDALAMHEKLDEAIPVYRKAVELAPQWDYTHISLGSGLAQQGKLDEAIASYRKAIDLNPNWYLAYNNLGNALVKQGKMDAALVSYRKATEVDPKNATAHNNLGFYLAKRGQLDEAITSCRKGIELDPKSAYLHSNLGFALAKQGKLDEAIASCLKGIELDPKLAAAHRNLGFALAAQGSFDKAIASYETAVELGPKDYRAHAGLGRVLSTCIDVKYRFPLRATELAQKAVELAPKEAEHWNTLGVARYRNGSWADAVSALHKSIELKDQGDSFDWFFLAMAHWQLGHKEEALKRYDQAVEWMEHKRPQDAELRRFRAEAAELLGIEQEE